MKLYICWGTFTHGPIDSVWPHPCEVAHSALKEVGHEPEVIKAKGLAILPDAIFNQTAGRLEAKRLTGSSMVPVLVTDNGEVIDESDAIVAWAQSNPVS